MKSIPGLLLAIICCFACGGQPAKDPSTNKQANTSTDIITSPPQSITRTIIQDSQGGIWLASWEGIFRFENNIFTNVSKEVSSHRFFSILEDKKGNFWFASVGGGVYYYDGKSFQNFTTKEGIANNRVINIYEDKEKNIWFSTESGISIFDGKTFKNLYPKKGETINDNDINAIIESSDGLFWIATRGKAYTYNGEKFAEITQENGTGFTNVRSILKDRQGNMWLGGNDGLWRFDGKVFTQLSENFTGYIYQDQEGDIWTSSESNSKTLKDWTAPQNNNTPKNWVLTRFSSNSLENLKPEGIKMMSQENMLFGILKDKEKNIWVGTLNGVLLNNGDGVYVLEAKK